MTVAKTNKFRRMCFERGVDYQVVKNTLIRKTLESLEVIRLSGTVLTGFSESLFHPESGKSSREPYQKISWRKLKGSLS
jgi:large subunit ribosomal protein L10